MSGLSRKQGTREHAGEEGGHATGRRGGGEVGVEVGGGSAPELGQPCRHPPHDTGAITVHLTYPATTPLLP